MIKLQQIKKDTGKPDWQYVMPNGDIVDIRVERTGNARIYHVQLPQPVGKKTFDRMAELREFLFKTYEG